MRESTREAKRSGRPGLDSAERRRFHRGVGTDGANWVGTLVDLDGTVFEGRFRLEERIAEGGFAVVYKAWQVALDRRVALKVLKPPSTFDEGARAEFREKFAAEAKTIARLRHPHIVDVYDFAVSTLPSGELAPWMALEWLQGETLALHLARRRKSGQRGRGPREAVEFLRPVFTAVAHAHEHAIAHRDIKPSNIMVIETLHGSSLRVLDFGIAKIMLDDALPSTGHTRTESAPAFSPAYAAPEQVAFSRTGPWTDVHALGLLLTEVMTDAAPFSDADPDAHLFAQVMSQQRPTPASKGREVGVYEPIIARALALSPRDRWRNAGDLLAALDAAGVASEAGEVSEARALATGAGATSTVTASEMSVAVPVQPSRVRWAAWLVVLAVVGAAMLAIRAWPSTTIASRMTSSRMAVDHGLPTAPMVETSPATSSPLAPLPTPASSASLTAAASAVVTPVALRPRKPKAKAAAAPLSPALDGRDLFDDTR